MDVFFSLDNGRVATMPKTATMDEYVKVLNEERRIVDMKIVALCVGHNDLALEEEVFMTEWKNIEDWVRKNNPGVF